MGRILAHTTYTLSDGTKVPGASTIANLIISPKLLWWYHKCGKEGIDPRKATDREADVGTLTHSLVEAYFRGEEVDTEEYAPADVSKAESAFINWLIWAESHTIEPILVEQPLVSEKHGYGGTPDFYGLLDGKKTLIDIKTSKGIYHSHYCQIAAYSYLLEECGHDVERIYVVRFAKSGEDDFEVHELSAAMCEKYFEIFLLLLRLWRLKKEVKWND